MTLRYLIPSKNADESTIELLFVLLFTRIKSDVTAIVSRFAPNQMFASVVTVPSTCH
jgi:hypothetical protein